MRNYSQFTKWHINKINYCIMNKLTVSAAVSAVISKRENFPSQFLTPPARVANEFKANFVDNVATITFDFTHATTTEVVAKTEKNNGKLIVSVTPLSKCGDHSTMALRLSLDDATKIIDSGVSTWVIRHSTNPSADGKIMYDQFTAENPVNVAAPANTTQAAPIATPATATT